MTAQSDAARVLGSRGGRAGTDTQEAARRANISRARRGGRLTAEQAEIVDMIREVGREHGDLALVTDARLWRMKAWRKELTRRVGLHDAATARKLERWA